MKKVVSGQENFVETQTCDRFKKREVGVLQCGPDSPAVSWGRKLLEFLVGGGGFEPPKA